MHTKIALFMMVNLYEIVKKRKNVSAEAPTSYDQTLNGHSSFYTILCIVIAPYSLLSAISIHRILHEILQHVD